MGGEPRSPWGRGASPPSLLELQTPWLLRRGLGLALRLLGESKGDAMSLLARKNSHAQSCESAFRQRQVLLTCF